MATIQNDGKKLHFGITYVNSEHLPPISKETVLKTIPRRLYAVLSVDDCPGVSYEIPSLDLKVHVPQMSFLAKPLPILEVQLFAKRSRHDDLLVAYAKVQLDSTSAVTELKVCLKPSVESGVTANPILVFKISTSDRFVDNADMESIGASLKINPKLVKALGYINLLIKVVFVIAELNDIAKAVMGVVELANSKFVAFIARNESILSFLEQVGEISMLVVDWDDPELDEDRPNQRQVYRVLLPAIYRSLHLLWTLSENNPVKRLSQPSVDTVHALQRELVTLVDRMQSNQHLDTQVAVFKISIKVTDLHDDNCINQLRSAKDATTSASKVCLPDTRVALRARIRDWALHPTSPRALLLHGAAGKGKSAVVHTIARELQSEGLAVVPFFAFNRSVPDRSSSQLIPTWAMQLARANPAYLRHLHTLRPEQLESSDILEQLAAFLVGRFADGIEDGRPIIFTIDALDECAEGEGNQLFHVLRNLLSKSDIPGFVRFLFTCRPDQGILWTFGTIPCVDIPIDDEQSTAEDIRKFVHDQLDPHPSLADMVDVVATASQTLFQCAAVLCRELTHTRKPKLPSARRDFLQRLRDGPVMSLYDSYDAILCIHFDKSDPRLMKLFRRVMAWILLVRSPQSRRVFCAFSDALLPDEERGDVKDLLLRLGSLLSGTTSENDPISPLHTSLRDFLLDPTHSGVFSVDLGPPLQVDLSRACLRILNTGLQFNICRLATSCTMNSDVADLPQRVDNYISPGLRYACLATVHHLRAILPTSVMTNNGSKETPVFGSRPIPELIGIMLACTLLVHLDIGLGVLFSAAAVLNFFWGKYRMLIALFKTIAPPDLVADMSLFFQHNFLFWLEAHSLMQSGRDGPGTLLPLFLEWTTLLQDIHLHKTVVDYIKFEKRFREGYMASAPQVYISGLVFAPRNSIVSSCYHSKFRNLIKTVGVLNAEWPPAEAVVIKGIGKKPSVVFSPDGAHIASGAADYTIRVWDAATGEQVGEPLMGHTDSVFSVSFSPDGKRIASGSADETVRVWDRAAGLQAGRTLTGHTGKVFSVVFSPDGTHLASGSDDHTIRVWNALTGQQVGEPLTGHTGLVYSVSFSPDGTRIASGSEDQTIQVWDVATGQQVGQPLVGHTDLVMSVAFSPDGARIASASWDYTIRMWDAVTGQQLDDAQLGHTTPVGSVAFSPDGRYIVSGAGDGTIRVWDSRTGQQVGETLKEHTRVVFSVAFSSDGMHIASASSDRTVKIRAWGQAMDQQVYKPPKGHTGLIPSVVFSPDGTRIASGSSDKTIRVWDAVTGQPVGEALTGHTGPVRSVAFSPDSVRIASGSYDKTVRMWDAAMKQQVGGALTGHRGSVNSVAFSPDGRHLASGSDDTTIRVWDAVLGKQIGRVFTGHTSDVHSVAFSPDGTQIASGSADKTIRVWDVATGQQVGGALTGHTGPVYCVAFSPDGTRLASGSLDETIRVWDLVTQQQVAKAVMGHTIPVCSVTFSPDGKEIASGSTDKAIWVWDVDTGQPVGHALTGHTGSVFSVAFTPDGARIASGSVDTTIRVQPNQKQTVQLEDGWLYHRKDEEKSYILWIPHLFREQPLVWSPNTMVLSAKPQISLDWNDAAIGPNWTNIMI